MPPRVTLAMIAEKDSPILGRCLASVAGLIDEIIVVTQPGGSAAWKAEIRRFDGRVYEIPWPDDFSAARNEALRHATGEWVLSLDADEWFDDQGRSRLKALLLQLPAQGVAGYALNQVSLTAAGRPFAVRPVRFFRNTPQTRWRYRVHEQITPGLAGLGAILEADVEIQHDGYVDPTIQAGKRLRNARLAALDAAERPDDSWSLFNAGTSAFDLGRPTDSLRLLEEARRRRQGAAYRPPPGELFAAIARASLRIGDHTRAMAACRDGRVEAPETAELYFIEAVIRRK